ncbi:MAG: hypothetical protein ACLP7J_18730 [Streptosporangiaceae bacterium]
MTAPHGITGKGPDYPETRLALRAWGLDARRLTVRSLNAATTGKPPWVARAMASPDGDWPHDAPLRAVCKKKAEHEKGVPDKDCTCGIYATTDLAVIERYLQQDSPVLGVVELGGRTIPAKQGYRAAVARVAAILLIDPMFTTHHDVLRELADAYRVPALVPHSSDPVEYRDLLTRSSVADEVERYLREHGG